MSVIQFREIACCACGVHFCMDEDFARRRQQSGEGFYCPSGHKQYYTDSPEKQLKKRLEEEERRRQYWTNEYERVKREKRALKGSMTKLKNRIANGVCPCCKRTFSNLHRHMQNKHPKYKELK